jgi:hypothetical protein
MKSKQLSVAAVFALVGLSPANGTWERGSEWFVVAISPRGHFALRMSKQAKCIRGEALG